MINKIKSINCASYKNYTWENSLENFKNMKRAIFSKKEKKQAIMMMKKIILQVQLILEKFC